MTSLLSSAALSSFPASDPPPSKRQRRTMNITQTYFLAHTARAKLSREASRGDHNLRLLVGHANMLDSLMVDLADAERQQAQWFQSVKSTNNKASSSTSSSAGAKSRHIQWADQVVESDQDAAVLSDSDSDSSESDDDDDFDGDDQFFVDVAPTPSSPTPALTASVKPVNEDDDGFQDDLEEDYADLALTRTNSHTQHPPELLSDDESEDDDLPSPPSPPQAAFDHFSGSQQQADETVVTSTLFAPTSSSGQMKSATAPSKQPKSLLPESSRPDFIGQQFLQPARNRESPIQAC